jgi:hypothetical protein
MKVKNLLAISGRNDRPEADVDCNYANVGKARSADNRVLRFVPIRPAPPLEMFGGYLGPHQQDHVTRKAGPAGGLHCVLGLQ